jgi:hypothetical protein
MKTKLLILSVLLNCIILTSNAQLVNMNPDTNGDPWWTGGVPLLTPEMQQEID